MSEDEDFGSGIRPEKPQKIDRTAKMIFHDEKKDYWFRPKKRDKIEETHEDFGEDTEDIKLDLFLEEMEDLLDPNTTVHISDEQPDWTGTVEIAERSQLTAQNEIEETKVPASEQKTETMNLAQAAKGLKEPTEEVDNKSRDWLKPAKRKVTALKPETATAAPKDGFDSLLVVEANDNFLAKVVKRGFNELSHNNVRVEVSYSSLNFKDALAIAGQPGVAKSYPHVPGIDAVGTIVEASHEDFKKGDKVLVTGYDLGVKISGGHSQFVSVPEDWIVPLPDGLSFKEAMIYGTAGLTAGLCVNEIIKHGTSMHRPILITGASGGVGMLCTAILSKLGYQVTAASRKEKEFETLKSMGAHEVIHSEEILFESQYALMPQKWGAAIDTLGSLYLEAALKGATYGSLVCSCGLAYDSALDINVFPFILRSVTLTGIDSVRTDMDVRKAIWEKLATDWKPETLDEISTEIHLEDVPEYAYNMLEGKLMGRTVINLKRSVSDALHDLLDHEDDDDA
ncbi:MAG: YhdH/YhfP family quinone oxidoreductase [Lentisphaeria bacterium]|nr:YhdH/YhfP family quinone oxidoreductase [Lentisphaeria bacterium]